ncbi:hypothetical protein CCR94_00185 [Rhodoblastus sphagnicola]|uniref:Glycosyltransferase RgtA/B/C/D-like domain-containing protein n=2 Tax=Rhodoblastus sphagnicola TaxID=333368 RepID=A0A2S6NHN7_9HYPH|nr:hypothetical protein CCR94_00185 [Rhodoblastus sphagnicola]
MIPSLRRILFVLWTLLLIWIVSPVFTAVNLEAYTARLQSMAAQFNGPGVLDYDRLMPLHVEYLYLTRSGVVFLLAGFNRLFGLFPDLGFRLLTLTSFVAVVLASATFARTWGALRYRLTIPILLLIPGVSQVAYYFNDNIVSAAFSACAFALIIPASTWRRFAGAGILMACAISCRIDATLVLPLLGLLAGLPSSKNYRLVLSRWCGLAAGLGATLGAVSWFGDFSFADAVGVSKYFRSLPVYASGLNLFNLIAYFGIAMAAVVGAGFVQFGARCLRRKDNLRLLAFVVAPLCITALAAVFLGSSVRYGYPLLTPFYALCAGWAVRMGLADWRAGKMGAYVLAPMIGVIIGVMPANVLYEQEGPQSVTGQLWNPLLWWRWQQPIRDSAEKAQALVTASEKSRLTLVIATHYNDDAYLRERLIYSGFTEHVAEEALPGCNGFFVFQKNGATLVDIRTDDLYGVARFTLRPFIGRKPASNGVVALPIANALACPDLGNPDAIYLTAYENTPEWLPPALFPPSVLDRVTDRVTLQVLPLTHDELAELKGRADTIAPQLITTDGRPIDYSRVLSLHKARYLHRDPHWPRV